MGMDATGKVYVPLDDLFRFIEKYAGIDTEFMQFNFNGMRVEHNDLVVDFAASSECHPDDWTEPPDWLKKEKK